MTIQQLLDYCHARLLQQNPDDLISDTDLVEVLDLWINTLFQKTNFIPVINKVGNNLGVDTTSPFSLFHIGNNGKVGQINGLTIGETANEDGTHFANIYVDKEGFGNLHFNVRKNGFGWGNTLLNGFGGNTGVGTLKPVAKTHIGNGSNTLQRLLLIEGYSDTFALQEWGDNNFVWAKIFRTSANRMKFTTSNYDGHGFDFEGNYNFVNKLGIGNNTPHSSAVLDITSTSKGVLLPRMTTAQINAIASPAEGLEVYNSTMKRKCFYNGSSWQQLHSSDM